MGFRPDLFVVIITTWLHNEIANTEAMITKNH